MEVAVHGLAVASSSAPRTRGSSSASGRDRHAMRVAGRAAAARIAAVGLFLLASCSRTADRPLRLPSETGESRDMIDEATALKIAAQAVTAHTDIPGDCTPTVQLKGDRYVVTYPKELAPGVRGSAFYLKVHIDARTGKVLSLQIGA